MPSINFDFMAECSDRVMKCFFSPFKQIPRQYLKIDEYHLFLQYFLSFIHDILPIIHVVRDEVNTGA
jgi:hypothetical protein